MNTGQIFKTKLKQITPKINNWLFWDKVLVSTSWQRKCFPQEYMAISAGYRKYFNPQHSNQARTTALLTPHTQKLVLSHTSIKVHLHLWREDQWCEPHTNYVKHFSQPPPPAILPSTHTIYTSTHHPLSQNPLSSVVSALRCGCFNSLLVKSLPPVRKSQASLPGWAMPAT